MAVLETNRRVVVRLPRELVDALDMAADRGGCHRSDVIRESVQFYLAEQERRTIRQQLIEGYQELGHFLSAKEDSDEVWNLVGVPKD